MTSRHLYFKLLKEDMKRKLWAAALLGLALFFTMPVALAMAFSDIRTDETTIWARVLEMRASRAISMLSFGEGYPMIFIVLFGAAVVLGVSTFAYLHNKKQIDFYHSLPVKRQLWFLVHISTGILLPAVIYLLSLVLALTVCGVNGAFTPELAPAAAVGFLGNMLYYILVYVTVVLAMMMTGTRLAAVLGSAVFFVYCPMLSGLVTGFYEIFFDTYYYGTPSVWSRVIIKLSPMFALIQAMTDGLTLGRIAGTMGAILAVGLLSFFLYLKRPSEAAGRTMAFGWSTGVIKIILVVAFGMAGGMFFYSMRDSLSWMVFGVIVGVVISHCVIEVIYHSDFKKLFCHEKTLALCMTAALAISMSFYFDIFRYDEYLPDEGSLACASIDFGEDSWVSYDIQLRPYFMITGGQRILDLEQLSATGAVVDIAREGIRQLDAGTPENGQQWCNVVVCYTLKSGRRVYRRYNMFLDDVIGQADQIYLDPEYKKVLYPGLTLDPEEAAGNLAYLNELDQVELLAGNKEKWKAVAQAYQQELMGLSITDREQESPIGELLLISDEISARLDETNEERDLRRYDRMYWYDGFFYPIYPSFTQTIAALKDCGITVGETLQPEALGAVQIAAYGPFGEDDNTEEMDFGKDYDNEPFTITYTEPEQIRAIMEAFSFGGHRDKNNMVLCSRYRVYPIPHEYDMAETMEARDYYGSSSRGQLIEGRVPDFVIRDFEEMWEEWKKE